MSHRKNTADLVSLSASYYRKCNNLTSSDIKPGKHSVLRLFQLAARYVRASGQR